MDNDSRKLGLDDLLAQDMTSYELFSAQPDTIKQRVRQRDSGSFNELRQCIDECRKNKKEMG